MTEREWADLGRWFERMTAPDYPEWEAGVRRIGGCAHPIHLAGTVRLVDSGTGSVVHELGDGGRTRLMVPCGNRRRQWCAPCSRVYQWDTWHLVKAGLAGGKGVPESVTDRPRAFVTLTAPSFGPVHAASTDRVCHPRRGGHECEHGRPSACWERHPDGDDLIGQPLCGGCFDYAGAVLWNAHAGRLWHRFTDLMRRQELPRAAGVSRREFAGSVRVSFVKVAEYQRRGLVHFHAVVRLDPTEEGETFPAWAGHGLIDPAVRRTVPLVRVVTPDGPAGQWELGWGSQVDVQPIPVNVAADGETDGAGRVAAYIAKYVTKAAECTGTVDRPLYCPDCRGSGLAGACPRCDGSGLRAPLSDLRVPPHARTLIGTAWRLGGVPELRPLRLRRWAHQFGYGGHFSSKSRSYSTTMTALRAARAAFRSEQTRKRLGITGDLVVSADLSFAGSGYADNTERRIAENIRRDIAENREIAREEIAHLEALYADDRGCG
ncbi:replication initiator [Streptomyces sp. TRM 70361]|uniref:replication initiator n=1 Tax=Streptomyces sp. TRM 70361 TaxID=3116553 RepID=UPI002E7B0164|nr:replication initiator [Streptomyces sp. TRM 70361]MEE1939659.1 replication initiator [Streptomyces sp. TRM 70361]